MNLTALKVAERFYNQLGTTDAELVMDRTGFKALKISAITNKSPWPDDVDAMMT